MYSGLTSYQQRDQAKTGPRFKISSERSEKRRKGEETIEKQDSREKKTKAKSVGGGRVVRWCWVNFQCLGVLLIWIIVGQEPIALAVGAGGDDLDIFLSSVISPFFLPLWETARYRLKYCLKEPLSPKQPTKPNPYLIQARPHGSTRRTLNSESPSSLRISVSI